MSKARSYKNEPFTSFEKQSYSVMKDDFIHEKLLTVKANIDSKRGGVNLKQTLNQKGEALTSTGQTKLWFYFRNNYSLYTKIEQNTLTLAYDHGVLKRNDNNFNFYGSVQTNRNLNNNLLRVGVESFSPTGTWSVNNMLQFNQNENSLFLFHKTNKTNGKWFLNNYNTIDLTGKSLKQSALLIAFKNLGEVNKQYSARFQMNGFSNVEQFKRSICEGNKVTLNYVNSKKGSYAHGLEFSSKLKESFSQNFISKLSTAVEVKLPEQNSTLKLRLSGNWAAALSLKHSIGSFGTYIWGAEISEIGSKNNIRFGVQVDLNL